VRVRGALWQPFSFVLALAGLAVAGYLTVAHFRGEILVCGVGDCQTVQNSPYAEIAGVPIALLGAGMYLTLMGLGVARWCWPGKRDVFTTVAFGLALAGALYAAYLTYLEIWVIRAICQWCVVSALLTSVILGVEAYGLRGVFGGSSDSEPPGVESGAVPAARFTGPDTGGH
jgi:uncharacterized membrane protein